MIPVLLAEDVRRLDAEAVARGVSIEQLMHNAGWAVARAARQMLGGTYGRRVVVVCGKGNNAGDGLVAAQLLLEQGAHVTAVLVFKETELNEHAARELARFGGKVGDVSGLDRELARADLMIDAIVGVGLTRAPDGVVEQAIQTCFGFPEILAVDVPSGVDADTGRVFDRVITARKTVTFGGYKPGLLFEPGRQHAGIVDVADIGTERRGSASTLGNADVRGFWPRRKPGSHKRNAGTVLVVAGSRAMPGAAALVAGASIHTGSGLTVLCAPEDVCRVVLTRYPEITTIPVPDSSEGSIDEKALDLLLPRMKGFHSMVIGPGLSSHPGTVDFVHRLLLETTIPAVVDADALAALGDIAEVLGTRPENHVVLTPHAGELARLTGSASDALNDDRIGAARAFTESARCVLVFKGPGTVTSARAADNAMLLVNPTGGSGLAQGGSGDVLAGMIASVVAQTSMMVNADAWMLTGAIPIRVASAVWVHGRAADRIAARVAPHPANATALIDEIGPTLHEVFA